MLTRREALRARLTALGAWLGRWQSAPALPRGDVSAAPHDASGDDWSGGYYELALQLGGPDDDRVDRALRALAAVPELDGWWPERPGASGARVACALASLDGRGRLYGWAVLPDGSRTACVLLTLREDEDDGPDWLSLGFPMGALSRTLPGVDGYPMGDAGASSLTWRRPLDAWLAAVGRAVFAAAPFQFGLIGFEPGGSFPLDGRLPKPSDAGLDGWLLPDGTTLRYLPASL